MTREEAIICLKGIKNYGRDTFNEQTDWQGCLDMAIEVLEQEPCDDCISREDVMDLYMKCRPYMATKLYEFEKGLKDLPSVSPRQRTGRWIEHIEPDEAEPFVLWICENCGTIERRKTHYCPFCGAKMEVQE